MASYEDPFSIPDMDLAPPAVIDAEYLYGPEAPEADSTVEIIAENETVSQTPESNDSSEYSKMLGETVASGTDWQLGKTAKTSGDLVKGFMEDNPDKFDSEAAGSLYADARKSSDEQSIADEDEFNHARKVGENLLQASDDVRRIIGRIREGDPITEQNMFDVYDALLAASNEHGQQSAAVFAREHLRRKDQQAASEKLVPSVKYDSYRVQQTH